MSQSDQPAEPLVELSVRLRDAHRRVLELVGSDDEKACATRKLLAITDAAKRDLGRASTRLDALLVDWDEGRIGAASDSPGPPATDDQT